MNIEKKLLLQRKLAENKRKQKIDNFIQSVNGITVMDCKNVVTVAFPADYYSNEKIPDAKADIHLSDSEIVNRIIKKIPVEENQILYVQIADVFIKIQIKNPVIAVHSLWHYTEKTLLFLNAEKTVMYEFGEDSRDEQHYLFDIYYITE